MSGGPLARPQALARRLASRVVNPGRRPSPEALRAAVAGKLVLVTGASHGIGRAAATQLAGAGATVLLVARSADVLEELAAELGSSGGSAFAYPADLTEVERIPALVERMVAEHGVPDVVVNNAGKSIRRSIDRSYERFHDFTRTIDLNYLGPVRLLLALLPAMRERGSGHVVNVSTVGVLLPPTPRWSAYQASKGAFDVWLRSAAAEMHADGVTATALYMALVHTRMSAPTSDFKLVPGMSPDEAAGLIAHAIVDRPPSIAPWWASAAALIGTVARGPSEAIVRRYARMHGDPPPRLAAPERNGRPPSQGDPERSAT